MKIQVLIENTALETGAQKALWHEHGLSLLIEAGGHRILFDTGKSGRFAETGCLLFVCGFVFSKKIDNLCKS